MLFHVLFCIVVVDVVFQFFVCVLSCEIRRLCCLVSYTLFSSSTQYSLLKGNSLNDGP